ncbi:RNA polymerase sigma factor [Rhabdothermincola sp.]|uniref:RNA polymerase sigma factor n=1 Tax=Rhabdothermincola sp. TaxID=2820405 RepID=UPI002FDFEE88
MSSSPASERGAYLVNRADLHDLDATALVGAVRRRDHGALALAHRRHAPAVHALARRLLGPVTLASEAAQEVFLRLWDRPERFDPARDRCGRSCSRRAIGARGGLGRPRGLSRAGRAGRATRRGR